MTRYTGHDLAVAWTYSGGTAWLEDDFRTLDVSESVNDANSTAGNDTYAGHLPTYADANASLEMLGTTGSGTVHWAKLDPRKLGTLEWYPEGTAATKAKAGGENPERRGLCPFGVTWQLETGFRIRPAQD